MLELFAGLFLFLGWAGILYFFVILCAITALVENERSGWAFLTILCTGTAWVAWSNTHTLHHIGLPTWGDVFKYAGIYFLIGLGWSVFKWTLYVKKNLNSYNDYKKQWMKTKGIKELNADNIELFKRALNRDSGTTVGTIEFAPQVDKHVDDLMRWASWWPTSMFWWIINSPIRRAYKSAFRLMRGGLQSISDNMFRTSKSELFPVVVVSPLDAELANNVSEQER